jgi:hypothetical protein
MLLVDIVVRAVTSLKVDVRRWWMAGVFCSIEQRLSVAKLRGMEHDGQMDQGLLS